MRLRCPVTLRRTVSKRLCHQPTWQTYPAFCTSAVICLPLPAAPPSLVSLEEFPCNNIRNFSIIAHIDHGKSTLADRLLEMTGTINVNSKGANQQVLDKLKVERERGITGNMFYQQEERSYLLNLIDTPGHVDFSWEVSRSMAACQGALLLVDASQGVQAQSLSVFYAAKERGLRVIPVLNKIDLPAAQPERVKAQIHSIFGINPADVLHISAKTGEGISAVLQAIVERIPPPSGEITGNLKAFLFDSSYDRYRGVISLVSIQDGVLRKGDRVASCHTRKKYEITELGQVGYMACNMKQSSEAHIGDTLHRVGEVVEPLPGFQPAKAMVYAGIYPVQSNDFPKLEESIKRLVLTDRSVTVQRESSAALGQGCRLGFLGSLHMDVFRQRLEDEYDTNIVVTAPTVPYRVVYKDRTVVVSNPTDFPDVVDTPEPIAKASIIVPEEYLGEMMDLCFEHRAEDFDHRYLESSGEVSNRVMLTCTIPLSEIVTDFFDKLKSRSSGFASFDYEDAGYKQSNLVKMIFLLNNRPVDALALIVHRSAEQAIGRMWVKKLHKVIPRQLFEVPIQAVVGKKVIARETLSALRADVTAGLYGGHYERKMKHLENQKEAKRKMKRIGRVELPQEAFFDILSNRRS
ncbi:GTP-binding protein lepa [Multifurca ochricompacta]|uniref:GTP-binding protein lepa n=1 Tax=Multifurca ochricompacta TaxID=376703 RepID=A0AAD4MB75_9AGAM|nr:GTP-binding protein lepa [Multifurca ochricompacta]